MNSFATSQQRRKEGQLRRKQLPRQSHGKLHIPHRNPITLLEASVRGRVPALIKLKYQLMSDSAFGFFRGAAPIMAYDLGAHPHTGITCQLCGDWRQASCSPDRWWATKAHREGLRCCRLWSNTSG